MFVSYSIIFMKTLRPNKSSNSYFAEKTYFFLVLTSADLSPKDFFYIKFSAKICSSEAKVLLYIPAVTRSCLVSAQESLIFFILIQRMFNVKSHLLFRPLAIIIGEMLTENSNKNTTLPLTSTIHSIHYTIHTTSTFSKIFNLNNCVLLFRKSSENILLLLKPTLMLTQFYHFEIDSPSDNQDNKNSAPDVQS